MPNFEIALVNPDSSFLADGITVNAYTADIAHTLVESSITGRAPASTGQGSCVFTLLQPGSTYSFEFPTISTIPPRIVTLPDSPQLIIGPKGDKGDKGDQGIQGTPGGLATTMTTTLLQGKNVFGGLINGSYTADLPVFSVTDFTVGEWIIVSDGTHWMNAQINSISSGTLSVNNGTNDTGTLIGFSLAASAIILPVGQPGINGTNGIDGINGTNAVPGLWQSGSMSTTAWTGTGGDYFFTNGADGMGSYPGPLPGVYSAANGWTVFTPPSDFLAQASEFLIEVVGYFNALPPASVYDFVTLTVAILDNTQGENYPQYGLSSPVTIFPATINTQGVQTVTNTFWCVMPASAVTTFAIQPQVQTVVSPYVKGTDYLSFQYFIKMTAVHS